MNKRFSPNHRAHFRAQCKRELEAFLTVNVVPIIAEECSTPVEALGAKVWLLPQPYYRWIRTERLSMLALADFYSQTLSYPRLRKLAEVPIQKLGPDQSSGTRRTLGKGAIGEALFGGRPNAAVVLIHSDNQSDRLGRLSKREYARLPHGIRRGMRRTDFLKLSRLYGSTVVVGLSPLDNATNGGAPLHPIGVLTVHTSADTNWDVAQCALAADWAGAAVSDCVKIIRKWGYRVPDSADMFTGISAQT